MNKIFDSHAHYNNSAFDEDYDHLLEHLAANDVGYIMNCGSSVEASRKAMEQSHNSDFMCFCSGIHPLDIEPETCDADFEEIEKMAMDPKCKAIGEIGLDYHWNTHPADVQKAWFEDQLEFAKSVDLPVIVHDREAHNDTLEILKKHKPKGVVHCFSGSNEMAKEILKLGMYIGVGGVVTFKNARKLATVVKDLPLDRLLLETDAPYLSPEPFRGKRCTSDLIYFTAQKVAEIKGISTEDVLKASIENIKTLYNKIK